MDESSVVKYLTEAFEGVDVVAADGNYFFFYDPDRSIEPDRRFPFVTLVTNDKYDQASNLDRPGVFRLNLGLSRATYRSLFDAQPPISDESGASDAVEASHDFTALDHIMPHPVYSGMFWICVLNPSAATFAKVRTLLAEAYDRAAGNGGKQESWG